MTQVDHVPPDVTNAGQDFSHVVWTAGTEITLCNVPWDKQYHHVMDWAPDQYNSYIDGLSQSNKITVRQATYARPHEPVRIPVPYNVAAQYNYLRVRNPKQPSQGNDFGQTYFYFIGAVNHIAPGTTEIIIGLDVWATYRHTMRFGRCFVEQGHVGMAVESDEIDEFARWLTQPEGHELGGSYQALRSYSAPVGDKIGAMILSTTALHTEAGSADDPKLESASGGYIGVVPHGANHYFAENLGKTMSYLKDKPWVGQGIISITLFPYTGVFKLKEVTGTEASGLLLVNASVPHAAPGSKIPVTGWDHANYTALSFNVDIPSELLSDNDFMPLLPPRYRRLRKFATFPYSFIEVTDYSGRPIEIKRQFMSSRASRPTKIQVLVSPFAPSAKMAYTLLDYNHFGNFNSVHKKGDWLDNAIISSELPQTSIVNNGYLAVVASNRNTIAHQRNLAEWSFQKSMNATNTQFSVAGRQMDMTREAGEATRAHNNQMAQHGNTMRFWGGVHDGMTGVATGGAMDIAQGSGGANAAAAAVGGGMNILGTMHMNRMHWEAAQYGNSHNLHMENIGLRSFSDIAELNRQLGVKNADIDRALLNSAVNSRVQDMMLTPPSQGGQLGGEFFMLHTNNGFRLDFIQRVIPIDAMIRIGEHWLNFGYVVNAWHTVNSLSLMSHFTYWRMSECNVWSSRCPEEFRATVRGIMTRGTTVWKNPANIGRMDPVNNVSTGLVKLNV